MNLNDVRLAKESSRYLLERDNVVGLGIGYKQVGGELTDELCIVVSVITKIDAGLLAPLEMIPAQIADVPTDVQQTGQIVALKERTERWRPAPGGVSIGHIDVTAGTVGCLVMRDDERFILSNNHVLANSNMGEKGDPIVQPGIYDSGIVPDDVIATLEDFVPVEFLLDVGDCPIAGGVANVLNATARIVGSAHRFKSVRQTNGVNLVDVAIARPVLPDMVVNEVLEIGVPTGVAEVELGDVVRKSGRTTGYTTGKVMQVDMTLQVLYGTAIAVFEDQIGMDCESAGGDSGSAIFNEDNEFVALLFAGGEGVTVGNRAQNVLDALGLEI